MNQYITIFMFEWPNTGQKTTFHRKVWPKDVRPTRSEVKRARLELVEKHTEDVQRGMTIKQFAHIKEEYAPEPDFSMPPIM